MSKQSRVLDYLESGKPITPRIALDEFGSFRLSSIINRLRKEGHNIETELVGEEKYARYKLIPKETLW